MPHYCKIELKVCRPGTDIIQQLKRSTNNAGGQHRRVVGSNNDDMKGGMNEEVLKRNLAEAAPVA
jgi:hypothetical protein